MSRAFLFPDGRIEFWTGKQVTEYNDLDIHERKVLLPGNGRLNTKEWVHEYCKFPTQEYCILTEDYRRQNNRFHQPVMLTIGQMVYLASIGGIRESVGLDLKTLYFSNLDIQALLESPHIKSKKDHKGMQYMPNLLEESRFYAIRTMMTEPCHSVDEFLTQFWGSWEDHEEEKEL